MNNKMKNNEERRELTHNFFHIFVNGKSLQNSQRVYIYIYTLVNNTKKF